MDWLIEKFSGYDLAAVDILDDSMDALVEKFRNHDLTAVAILDHSNEKKRQLLLRIEKLLLPFLVMINNLFLYI